MKLRGLPFLFLSVLAAAQGWTRPQVEEAMGTRDFVLLRDDGTSVARWARRVKAGEAFAPCSTFKLPHALVALQAGVLTLDRQTQTCARAECHGEHGTLDLAAAIRESCVSYFRQTARALEPLRMTQGLKALGYPVTGPLVPLDGFWLEGKLRLTPEQQLAWIRRFYTEPLGVAPVHLDLVRRATLRAPGPDFALEGKTGSGRDGLGWFVGQATRDGRRLWVVLLLRGRGASGPEAERRLRSLLAGGSW